MSEDWVALTVAASELDRGGIELWNTTIAEHEYLNYSQRLILLEACRSKDRLDKLNEILRGDAETWMTLRDGTDEATLVIDAAASLTDKTQNTMAKLIATLRLPDASGQSKGNRAGRVQATGARGANGSSVRDRLRSVT